MRWIDACGGSDAASRCHYFSSSLLFQSDENRKYIEISDVKTNFFLPFYSPRFNFLTFKKMNVL